MIDITPTDAAYLAGFYDGEGSFQIQRRWHTVKENGNVYRYIGYSLYSEVANTNKKVLEHILKLLGVGSIHKKVMTGNRKEAWGFKLGGKHTLQLIEKLKPYLIVKTPIAEVCLQFPYDKTVGTKDEIIVIKEKLFEEARLLNKRGIY